MRVHVEVFQQGDEMTIEQSIIAELRQQIEHQRVGSREVEKAMQKQDQRIAELERENKLLRGGMAMCGPAALWPEIA